MKKVMRGSTAPAADTNSNHLDDSANLVYNGGVFGTRIHTNYSYNNITSTNPQMMIQQQNDSLTRAPLDNSGKMSLIGQQQQQQQQQQQLAKNIRIRQRNDFYPIAMGGREYQDSIGSGSSHSAIPQNPSMSTNISNNSGGIGTAAGIVANSSNGGGANTLQSHIQALSQKNHRLAKELSDLRVRHREETKVVSRLTMENMNLASRCREAISQVAALKKEMMISQRKHSILTGEYQGLQRENSIFRKGMIQESSGKTNNLLQQCRITDGEGKGETDIIKQRCASPTTELDRIMSSQKFGGKKPQAKIPLDNSKDDSPGDASKDNAQVGKKNQPLLLAVSSPMSNLSNPSLKITNNKSTNLDKLTISNNKIPITVTSVNSAAVPISQIEDEFDADIDMVDFFNSQQSISSSTGSAEPVNTKTLHHHVRKSKGNTDDIMPGDVLSTPGSAFSPEGTVRKHNVGESLISSLDAFEASFASAFPETSFSITSDAPKEVKLDMAFEVPDFGDPFFKTATSTSNKDKDKSLLFPEAALNFKMSPMPLFDSTPMSFNITGPSIDNRVKTQTKGLNKSSRLALAPLSPQSMSAEFEQLDAIANLSISNDKQDSSTSKITRKIRNVKQPVSYAEPSTKNKLRRGDVLFPKVDAHQKHQQNNFTDESNATGPQTTIPQGNTAEVLKDLELVSSMNAPIDLTKE